jgi:phage gpG-like protein
MGKNRVIFRTKDSDPGFGKVIARIGKQRAVVRVGLFSSKSGNELVKYAAVNEFGTTGAGFLENVVIPERSYLRATVDENSKAIIKIIEENNPKIVLGLRTTADVLDEIGLFVVGQIQLRISKGIKPANAPSTIKAKGSSKPLIDTGRLRQEITHIVRKKFTKLGGFN